MFSFFFSLPSICLAGMARRRWVSLVEFYVKIISWSEKQNFEPLLVEA